MISKRLKSLREDKDMSQKDLAGAIGVSPSTIGMYESNKRTPDSEMLNRLADFFDVSVDYLLGRTNEQKLPTTEFKPKLTEKDKKDLDKVMINFEEGLEGSIMLDGEILDDNTKKLFLASVRHAYELAKLNNKAKYTPKKYRK